MCEVRWDGRRKRKGECFGVGRAMRYEDLRWFRVWGLGIK